MKYAMLAILLMLPLAGCAAIKDGCSAVEAVLKSPPDWLITAGRMCLDFALGLLNVFLHGVLSGLPGGFGSALGL